MIQRGRRGTAAVAMIIVLVVLQLVVVGLVNGGAREQDLTTKRLDTVRAVYAAEAGINMAIRELMNNADEDGDGAVGSISSDGNSGNDPALGVARFTVTRTVAGGQTTLLSAGRCGDARRSISAVTQ